MAAGTETSAFDQSLAPLLSGKRPPSAPSAPPESAAPVPRAQPSPAPAKDDSLYAPLSQDETQSLGSADESAADGNRSPASADSSLYAPLSKQEQDDLYSAPVSKDELAALEPPPEPDMSALKEHVQQNLKGKAPASLLEAVESGLQMSTAGLVVRGKAPDILMPEDAPTFYRIAGQMSQMAGDLPAMLAGGVAGAPIGGAIATAAGPEATPVGAAVGAGAGANALPAALRKILMDHYEKGDIQNFGDFWERLSSTFLDTMKAGVVGGATFGVGNRVKALAPIASPLAKAAAAAASEVATMVTLGKGLEGQVPHAQDFLDAAVAVGGLHLAGEVAGKLRTIYAETGVPPHEVIQDAQTHPTVAQDLLSSNVEVPKAYESAVDKPAARFSPEAQKQVDSLDAEIKALQSRAQTPADQERYIELVNRRDEIINSESESQKTAGPIEAAVPKSLAEPSAVLQPGTETGTALTEAPPAEQAPAQGDRLAGRSDAEKAVLEKIKPSADDEKPGMLSRLFSSAKDGSLYTATIDDLHPVKQFVDMLSGDAPLAAAKDPYVQMRLTRGAYGKADQFLQHSPFDFETLKNSDVKPLREIVVPFKSDLDGFKAYMAASRAVELSSRGIESGIPLDAAKEVVRAGAPKYEQGFRNLVDYQNSTLQYLKDSGILSAEAFSKMKDANQNYVPFYRLMDDATGSRSTGGSSLRNPVKGIEGSARDIVDPLESIVKNTYLYVTLAERNRALSTLRDFATSTEGGGELMKKVRTPMQAVDVSAPEVQRFLDANGIEGDAKDFTVFRPKAEALESDQVAIYKNGKREIYQLPEGVAQAVKSLDAESASMLVKILRLPAQALRAGSVFTPDFIARHGIRNQLMATAFSKSGFIPVFDTLRGLGSLLKEDESYQNWLKSGGANSSAVSIDRDYIENNVFKLSKETGLIDKTWNVVKSPFEAMRVLFELQENALHLGEFKKATAGDTSPESIMAGGFASRDVTVDPLRIGAYTKAINSITAFWNIHMQGLDKMAREFKENPLPTTAKMAASITLPSVLLWFANKDDPRWQEIPRWQKDLFWIVMTKDHVYRIPKPFEPGVVFGSLPERVLESFFSDHPRAMKDFTETMVHGITPNYIPTFAQPMIEHLANKSMFMGGPIVPHQLEGLLPEYQYTEYTSEAGKALGKLVAAVPGQKKNPFASPAVLENYIRAWSGGTGMYALGLADKLLRATGAVSAPEKPAATLADIPFVKAFVVRYPTSTAQSIQDFYERYDEHKQIQNTVKHLAHTGDVEHLQKELSLRENQAALFQLDGVREALTNQSRFIQTVYANPNISASDKRQIIDGAYYGMIETAKAGNQTFDGMEVAAEGAK